MLVPCVDDDQRRRLQKYMDDKPSSLEMDAVAMRLFDIESSVLLHSGKYGLLKTAPLRAERYMTLAHLCDVGVEHIVYVTQQCLKLPEGVSALLDAGGGDDARRRVRDELLAINEQYAKEGVAIVKPHTDFTCNDLGAIPPISLYSAISLQICLMNGTDWKNYSLPPRDTRASHVWTLRSM